MREGNVDVLSVWTRTSVLSTKAVCCHGSVQYCLLVHKHQEEAQKLFPEDTEVQQIKSCPRSALTDCPS